MSIEAVTWALNTAPIPTGRNASTLASVLIGLANHADPEGRNAFPAVATLARYTRLSERSVQYALRALEDLGLITPSDPGIVAAYVKRADRRPQGWDLPIHSTIHNPVHNCSHEVQQLHAAGAHGVQTQPNGVQTTTPRGASTAPEPSWNHPKNRPARKPADPGPTPAGIPPVCGDCDARDTDPLSARIIWLDPDRQHSTPCPRCHPTSISTGGAGDRHQRHAGPTHPRQRAPGPPAAGRTEPNKNPTLGGFTGPGRPAGAALLTSRTDPPPCQLTSRQPNAQRPTQ